MTKKKLATMLTAMGLVGVVGIGGTLAWLTAETNEVVNTFAIGPGYTNEDGSVKIDILESLVTRNTSTGVFSRVDGAGSGATITGEENTTNDGQSFANETYSYLTYDADAAGFTAGSTVEGIMYKGIVPGSVIPKNPTVRVDDEIVNSRLYVLVDGLDELGTTFTNGNNVATPGATVTMGSGWTKVNNDGTAATTQTGDGYYQYTGTNTTGGIILAENHSQFYTEPLFTEIQVSGDMTEAQIEAWQKSFNEISVKAGIIQSDNVTASVSMTEMIDVLN